MRLLPTLMLLGLAARSLTAQGSSQRMWASVGLGSAEDGGIITASASFSRGVALIVGRMDAEGALFGPVINDQALLFGLRTPGGPSFLSAAVGPARTRLTIVSSDVAPKRYAPHTGVGFQVKVQGGGSSVQGGFGMLGVVAPDHAGYVGAFASVDVGSFGR